jgi:hypothetical protein
MMNYGGSSIIESLQHSGVMDTVTSAQTWKKFYYLARIPWQLCHPENYLDLQVDYFKILDEIPREI